MADYKEDKEEKVDIDLNDLLSKLNRSIGIRDILQQRWTRNQKILKGIPVEDEKEYNTTTKRRKLRFRKVWAAAVRLLASLYQAYLKDKQKFKITGVDEVEDYLKARVLEKMVQYRLNWGFRRRNWFTKFLWAFMEAISPGFSVVKFCWKFNDDLNIDEPDFVNYPLEQVALDWSAGTPFEMRYAFLENYLGEDQMEEMGYENIDDAIMVSMPQSDLRATRFYNGVDPMTSTLPVNSDYNNGSVGDHYPKPGSSRGDTEPPEYLDKKYRCVEAFCRKNGKVYFGVFNPEGKVWLKKAEVSAYGDIMPIATGSLLLEAHKLVPESLVEPLEGPQEDLNMNINLRKANQYLAMQGGFIYGKYDGVDLQALSNLRPGFRVGANNVNAVAPIKIPDVTQSSYAEAGIDENMIDEMSGVNPTKQGNQDTTKTGVAEINLQESNAKESLYVAIVGETLFRQMMYLLAYGIQLFETDEKIFRVTNEQLRREGVIPAGQSDIYALEFDMDVDIEVGISEASRAVELQRAFLAVQNMTQANQATAGALASGIQMPNAAWFDPTPIFEFILKKLDMGQHMKNIKIPMAPPKPEEPAGGEAVQNAQGNNAQSAPATDPAFMNLMTKMMGK